MRLPQLQRPLQAACIHGGYRPVLASFSLPIRPTIPTAQALRPVEGSGLVEGRRYASVKSQGAYRIPNKKTIAKKLGAKKSGDQFVIPGNIIFKQRGTIWHAGQNAIRGRDHTIHAAATGYVKYYRDPEVHPTRQFIGVAFNKEDTLPYPKKEPRRRKLGLVAHVRKVREAPRPEISDSGIPNRVLRKAGLWNLEALERRLWNADKRRELREAEEQHAREAKAALRGLPQQEKAAEAVSSTEVASTSSAPGAATVKTSGSTSPDDFATAAAEASVSTHPTIKPTANKSTTNPAPKKLPGGQKERTRPVTPGEYLQKSWQERRHTKVLLLNPRSYAYAESNAAIGRLSSKTMYRAPWKLGSRKSRFRNRRRKVVAAAAKAKADKEFVRAEKAKERLAEEKKRLAKLEKQRARGAKRATEATETPEAGEGSGEKAGKPVVAEEAAPSIDAKSSEKPAVAKESQKPAETKEENKPTKS
ncbi:hypothetical protein N0V82_006672 [Gnomoniopsis sp. IMI 355080]|nr:hypothetical protein N0V82_006672 [Gnomoniopsis sp. IMI 355080]